MKELGIKISDLARPEYKSILDRAENRIEEAILSGTVGGQSLPDFNERLTRYQVEHIAGGRGSRTKYIPPRCDTLRTHGVCPSMDDICREVRHPLAYYRRKLRVAEREPPVEEVVKT